MTEYPDRPPGYLIHFGSDAAEVALVQKDYDKWVKRQKAKDKLKKLQKKVKENA